MIKAFGIDFGKINGDVVVRIMRLMALPSLLVVILIGYDFVAPATKEVRGVIISKYKNPSASSNQYFGARVNYPGRSVDEEVNSKFYNLVQKNDELTIKESKIFGNWKEVEIHRNKQPLEKFNDMGSNTMLLIGLIFLLPILSFTPLPKLALFVFSVLIFIPEILAVVFCVRLTGVLLGVIPHF